VPDDDVNQISSDAVRFRLGSPEVDGNRHLGLFRLINPYELVLLSEQLRDESMTGDLVRQFDPPQFVTSNNQRGTFGQ
jgi:hypothetical protein